MAGLTGEKWRPDRIGDPEAAEIRRGGQEERERSRGRFPSHSGPGSLLSSQANPLPSKAPLPPAALVPGA